MFGKTIKIFGDSTEARPPSSEARFWTTTWSCLDGEDRLVATLVSGQEDETESRLKELVKARPRANRDALADTSTSIDEAFTE